MRKLTALALMVILALPSFAEDTKDSTAAALGKAAGAKIGEAAAKWLAGKLYDSSCVNVNNDAAISYVCDVMRGFSGRDESEWKAQLEAKLNAISTKLDNIETVQRDIQNDLKKNHAQMNAKVEQLAADIIATEKLVRIDGLWEKYQTQFDKVDNDVKPESMIAFAKEIIAKEPHSILTELNVLMTKPPKGQPLVKYPFYEWRVQNPTLISLRLDAREVYEFAEKKFVEYRGHQQKAYSMYLWAASVLQTQCQLHPNDCTKPPRPLADFQADYDRYTRLQAAAFNSAVDWFLLTYGRARASSRPNFLPETATSIYLRANLLTSAVVGDGQGLWGRVISMGNKWDGSLQVKCGGTTHTLKPVLSYTAPTGGNGMLSPGPDDNRPFDWWVSTAGNGSFDEVHFSDNWQMHHYSLPSAPVGTCTVVSKLPAGGVLPWIDTPAEIVNISIPGVGDVRGGSFLAIQRAGGNYALASGGNWVYSPVPEKVEEGKGDREQDYKWMIEPDHPEGPYIGVHVEGRATYMPRASSRIRNKHRIVLTQAKDVRFPEGGAVKFMFYPGNCGSLCQDNSASIIYYDQPNYDGKLTAQASVRFLEGSIPDLPRGGGVFVESKYDKTRDRRSANINTPQSGVFDADPSKNYRLQYELLIDMENEGPGLDAAQYHYLVRLAPGSMFVMK